MKKFKCAVRAGNMPKEEPIEKREKEMSFFYKVQKLSLFEYTLYENGPFGEQK